MRANPSPDTTEKGYHAPAARLQSGCTEPMCYGKRGGRAHARARTVVAVREGDDAVDVEVGLRADLGSGRIVVSERAVPNTTVNPVQSGCACKATMRPSPERTSGSSQVVGARCSTCGARESARAGYRRFWPLSAPRAHTKAPYKPDLLWETLRSLNRHGRARTDMEDLLVRHLAHNGVSRRRGQHPASVRQLPRGPSHI